MPNQNTYSGLRTILEQFELEGQLEDVIQIERGYINRTWCVQMRNPDDNIQKYILQRINTEVFPDPEGLMHNYELVTETLKERLQLPGSCGRRAVQTIYRTRNGETFLRNADGCWRILSYLEDVYSLDVPDSPETFYYAGVAFGSFLRQMMDVEPENVNVVIPNFHNTLSRYRDLEAAIEKDPVNRVRLVEKEIAFVRKHKYLFGKISEKLDDGSLPWRICHNDCNLNNVLFDNTTHKPVVIIDLDTVMPSSPLYDFGDSMRVGTNPARDDEKDLSRVWCDLEMYRQYARGWLQSCAAVLTEEELYMLPWASLVITSEDGIRFLMDYINGDTYYTTSYPEQNLDRARTQLTLLEDMERKLPEIRRILNELYQEMGVSVRLEVES